MMTALFRSYCLFLVFSAFANSFWFNLLGAAGAALLLAATTVTTIGIWLTRRTGHRAAWRGVGAINPILIYLGFAALSLAWSSWPTTTLTTLAVQSGFVLQALFLIRTCTGRELLRLVEHAVAAVLVLSVVLEVGVALSGSPLLPNFIHVDRVSDPHIYWVRGNLFDGDFVGGGRIQGIVGNANLLAAICVVAMIVAAVQTNRRHRDTVARAALFALALVLCLRAGSATMLLSLVPISLIAVFTVVARRSSEKVRRLLLVGAAIVAMGVAAAIFLQREVVFGLVGKDASLTGRTRIWEQVRERADESPLVGHGYASPWLPWDPAFAGWITDHGLTVFHAHNMWMDVYLQLGIVGAALLAFLYGTALRRSWRLASQPAAPRAAMAPLLILALLLIQGLTESAPIMYWGLGLVTAFAARPAARSTEKGFLRPVKGPLWTTHPS